MKVLHVLYQSLPNTAGSSIRSRDIIYNQLKIGIKPIVITSPFQMPFQKGQSKEILNGIKYYRTFSNDREIVKEKLTDFITQIKKLFRIFYFTLEVYKVAKKENVDLIHAHAMFYCAFPAKIAGFFLKKPMIYEVRSLWEERYKSGSFIVKCMYDLITFLETYAMFLSNKLIAINQNLKKDLQSRLLLRGKEIDVISNAIDLSRVNIIKSSKRKLIFSYIGTISPIEGLDLLIKSFNNLYKKGYKNKLLIFGDGQQKKYLMKIAKGNPLIEFRGKFLQKDIAKVYSSVDVIINPRKNNYLTNSVTPIKPLEAMAYKKLVLASNVGGMNELIINEVNGILFKADSAEEIENVIINILARKDLNEVVENGYKFVQDKKNWFENAKKYKLIYDNLIYV